MARDVELILDDILDTIALIDQSLTEKDRSKFDENYMLQLGVQRAIEIISEASKHISPNLQEQAPDVPWRSIRAMGNILRHEYHRIANDVIWDVIVQDLPVLKSAILFMKTRL